MNVATSGIERSPYETNGALYDMWETTLAGEYATPNKVLVAGGGLKEKKE